MDTSGKPGSVPIQCGKVAVTVLRKTEGHTKVLLMRRAKGALAGLWCQVTGRVEADETAWQAALREVREETGIELKELYTGDYCDFFYDPFGNTIEALPIFVGVADPASEVLLNNENTEFCWVDIPEAAEMVPFVGHRYALREILRDFVTSSPQPWRAITAEK